MRCGFCPAPAVWWIEWRTIGRPKGAPACMDCAIKRDEPDNWGDRLTVVDPL